MESVLSREIRALFERPDRPKKHFISNTHTDTVDGESERALASATETGSP